MHRNFDRNRIKQWNQASLNPIHRFDLQRINDTHGENDNIENAIFLLKGRIDTIYKLRIIYQNIPDQFMDKLILTESQETAKIIMDLGLKYHVSVSDIIAKSQAEILRSDIISARMNIEQNEDQADMLYDLVDENQQLIDFNHPEYDALVNDLETQYQVPYNYQTGLSSLQLQKLRPLIKRYKLTKQPHNDQNIHERIGDEGQIQYIVKQKIHQKSEGELQREKERFEQEPQSKAFKKKKIDILSKIALLLGHKKGSKTLEKEKETKIKEQIEKDQKIKHEKYKQKLEDKKQKQEEEKLISQSPKKKSLSEKGKSDSEQEEEKETTQEQKMKPQQQEIKQLSFEDAIAEIAGRHFNYGEKEAKLTEAYRQIYKSHKDAPRYKVSTPNHVGGDLIPPKEWYQQYGKKLFKK